MSFGRESSQLKHEWGACRSTRRRIGWAHLSHASGQRREGVELLLIIHETHHNCWHQFIYSCREGKDTLGGFWGGGLLGCEMRPVISFE
eukprot:7121021-Prymnesium_polylepis.1